MDSMELGSKSDAFLRHGRTWSCATGLPSDVVVNVGEMSFHLHKFPLLSRSGVMEKLIAEASDSEDGCVIGLPDIPGGDKTFELVAKFCYGVKLELTAANVVYLRCAAQHLEMTDEYGGSNLVSRTENFLNQFVLRSWKASLRALETCDDDSILLSAEVLRIPSRCIEAMAAMACSDPSIFGWPITENVLGTGDQSNGPRFDWWYEDATSLNLSLCYAKRYLPSLYGRSDSRSMSTTTLSEEDQRLLIEEIDSLLPTQKGIVPTKFLFNLMKSARILQAKATCIANLERRAGAHLDQATLEDLLIPNASHSTEGLYDVDSVYQILEHFLTMDQIVGDEDDQLLESPSLTPIILVGKLIDGYLAEVASDVNLKLPKFQSLAAAIPEYARPLDDGLYRAIDIYL